jgi:hypothetical protein
LRDILKGGGYPNPVLLSPAGLSRAYAYALLRYSGDERLFAVILPDAESPVAV